MLSYIIYIVFESACTHIIRFVLGWPRNENEKEKKEGKTTGLSNDYIYIIYT